MTDPLRMQAVAALVRAHHLFVGTPSSPHIADVAERTHAIARHAARLPKTASARSGASIKLLNHSSHADRTVGDIIAAARADHEHARAATRAVLEAAESDVTPAADTPMGRREAMARTATRLRTQHRHVIKARRRAKLLARRLRRLHYPQRRSMHGNHSSGRQAVLAAIRKALDIKGIHDPAARARWERGMDLVARRESNYNANAINNWDSNAARGTPSKGAWQFIAPTFAAYHQPGTSCDIHNLVAQACAFINYAMGRYGVAVDASNLADRIQQADPRRSPKGY